MRLTEAHRSVRSAERTRSAPRVDEKCVTERCVPSSTFLPFGRFVYTPTAPLFRADDQGRERGGSTYKGEIAQCPTARRWLGFEPSAWAPRKARSWASVTAFVSARF